jgi:cell surface protein SprA
MNGTGSGITGGMPKTLGGSFAISTISFASLFDGSKAANNYRSHAFERFLTNREIIAARVQERYDTESGSAGMPHPTVQTDAFSRSADVLIPAFLSAYTGRDVQTIALTPFPRLTSLLPNWNLSYDLLTMIPTLRDHLRSLDLTHGYTSRFQIGSYASFQSWVPLREGSELGFVSDPVTGQRIPSSRFDISSAAIVESFNPLLQVNTTLNNNLNFVLRLNRTRALNLNVGSYQIVETNENDLAAGMGYQLSDWTLRIDLSRQQTRALIRKIEDGFTQATSGIRSTTVRLTADYAVSQKLTLQAYYDTIIHRPLVSSTSYPTSVTNGGINLKFNL